MSDLSDKLIENKLKKAMGTIKISALFSDDKKHRYYYYVNFNNKIPEKKATIIMMNPSTSDEKTFDATVNKIINIADRNDFTSVEILNLFSYIDADPKEMKKYYKNNKDTKNIEVLIKVINSASTIIPAWGSEFHSYASKVINSESFKGKSLLCIQTNQGGAPSHPRVCKANSTLKSVAFKDNKFNQV